MSKIYKQYIAKKSNKYNMYVIVCNIDTGNQYHKIYIDYTSSYNNACQLIIDYALSLFNKYIIISDETINILKSGLPYDYKYFAMQNEFRELYKNQKIKKSFNILTIDTRSIVSNHIVRLCNDNITVLRKSNIVEYSEFHEDYKNKYNLPDNFRGSIHEACTYK